MFWKKKDASNGPKLPGPRELPEPIKKVLLSRQDIDPGSVPFLKLVSKTNESGSKIQAIRVFDPSDAEARKVTVKDYNSLNENPEIIIADGQYDETAKKAELTLKKAIPSVKLLSLEEILQQVEALKEPGSSAFFYMAAGPAAGGPLGRGSSIIKVNSQDGEKKQKKYAVYGAAVIDMKPVKDQLKIFDCDKAKDVAKWLVEAQKPRFV
jgi:hypothetical protein